MKSLKQALFDLRSLILASSPKEEKLVNIEYPPLTASARLYVIGDIHGRADLLARTHGLIDDHKKNLANCDDHIHEIYLGDYIDRGSDTNRVLEQLIARQRTASCTFVRGNHEAMLLNLVYTDYTPVDVLNWLKFGGAATAISYGLNNLPRVADESTQAFMQKLTAAIPPGHIELLQSTVKYAQFQSYVFAHAGIAPEVALTEQTFETMSTIRQGFLDCEDDFGFIVVHGHTPDVKPEFKRNRINIDTGAYATGKLTCLLIDGDGPRLLES